MTSQAIIWVGDLEPYMDDQFITHAFAHYGEIVSNVKLIRNKVSGTYAGYGFVEFSDADTAQLALHRLNGKAIPNSHPIKYFKLNHANHSKDYSNAPEYSLFVGDLTEDVDNYTLYQAFVKRYRSCRAAKVVYENDGHHKGYGFVRFSEEHDLNRAVKEMQHASGIGRKPIRVGPALPKNRGPLEAPGSSNHRDPYYTHYSQHYPPYSSYYGSWSNQYPDQYYQYPYPNTNYQGNNLNYYENTADDDSEILEDPCLEIDIEKMNKEFMAQSEEFYEALESSRWQPLDSATSQVPTSAVS